jgi:hypothetical protein
LELVVEEPEGALHHLTLLCLARGNLRHLKHTGRSNYYLRRKENPFCDIVVAEYFLVISPVEKKEKQKFI